MVAVKLKWHFGNSSRVGFGRDIRTKRLSPGKVNWDLHRRFDLFFA